MATMKKLLHWYRVLRCRWATYRCKRELRKLQAALGKALYGEMLNTLNAVDEILKQL